MINSINPYSKDYSLKSVDSSATKAGQSPTEVQAELSNPQNNLPVDQLDLGSSAEKSSVYSKPGTVKPDLARIEALRAQAEETLKPLRDMVEQLFKDQGLVYKKGQSESSNDTLINITPEMRAEAQKQIAPDGAFSAENTSTRIVDFAKAISGDDKTKIKELRESIQKGYAEASKIFGGKLPDISKQTLDLTMKKLDEWEQSGE